MIKRHISVDFGGGDGAVLSQDGIVLLTLNGREMYMPEAEVRRLWSNLGTLFRESAKWNG